jgi:Calreticulin family
MHSVCSHCQYQLCIGISILSRHIACMFNQNAMSRMSISFLPWYHIGLCSEMSQVHLILRHKSPKTGEIEEKHLKLPPSVLLDDKTHVYTAVLHPNNT